MKSLFISLLIVLSIALQSFVAVAESGNNHQVNAKHLQTEHSHKLDKNTVTDISNENGHNIEDCHHCGHCQGSHAQWLTSKKSPQLTSKLLVINQYFYLTQLNKSFIEELIRPPIA
jgi:ABC-type nickel/cobalt efflux system permease component RcnA